MDEKHAAEKTCWRVLVRKMDEKHAAEKIHWRAQRKKSAEKHAAEKTCWRVIVRKMDEKHAAEKIHWRAQIKKSAEKHAAEEIHWRAQRKISEKSTPKKGESMELILAKTAGFCFGVKRAVEKVYESIEKGGHIYTYGPIIHNEQVVAELGSKGVKVIGEDVSLEEVKDGVIIIRSHGVSRKEYEALEATGAQVVDATCPFVGKIHKLVEQASSEGKRIVIVGNAGHPEVEGIRGWSVDPGLIDVVGSTEDAKAYPGASDNTDLLIVAQTTFNSNKFKDIVEILSKKEYNANVVDTICNATQERQSEAMRIAERVSAGSGTMIVIGGRNSSNSRKLYEICSERCENTHFIQTLEDLYLDDTKSIPCVGITAGASTPDKIIEEVQKYVRANF